MTKPIIPWMGGKGRLAKEILPLFPEHQCYVEVFAGGAALFYKKKPAKAEVLNDINGELVNLYRVVQHHLEEFIRQFKWALTSRQIFEWEKQKQPETLTDIQRAARFYYLQKLAFGGKVDGQTYGTATTSAPRLNLLRLEEDLSAAHLRLSRVNIENLDWVKCIEKYDREHTLFYLDPPYYETAGYGVDFGLEQYEKMAELARTINGKMIISINNHEVIQKVFKGFNNRPLNINYTVGGRGKKKAAKELLIWNW
ncbi:DNA adenine methylase [Methylophaga nitratireducenticrescens]|uniref:DNA adenine methylase n=1 Tax=Methylophaga nitratireducenticrescens TaxID=754476 RepID=UPI000CDC4A10|nr:DNA adenine methylase [Methylophaga nitratireducenticrescens]AUZ85776.1 restriction endonuclease subunit M [Methylophaga nitratireducenticrescens]AUZ85832.1 restriction endonuclease subunit M [Methylophaga nitratireducenticrescens]